MPWGQNDGPVQGKEANQFDMEKLISYLTFPQSKSTVDICGYCSN